MSVDLYAVYIGEETTRGTAVAATAKLAGFEGAPITPGVEVWRGTDERRGSLAPAWMDAVAKIDPSAKLSGVATWQQIGNILDALFGKATPSGTGPYTRSYAAPLGSLPTLTPWTLYYGDGSNVWRMAGALMNEVTLSGAAGEPLKVDSTLIGMSVGETTAPNLPDPTVQPIISGATLYMDDEGGSIGTTMVTDAVWFSWELSINPNRANVFGVDSTDAKASHRERKWDGTLKLVLSVSNTSKAMLSSLTGGSNVRKQIRIRYALGQWYLNLDFAGTLTETSDIVEDEDGVATLSMTFGGLYNGNLGNWLKAELVNDVATLP